MMLVAVSQVPAWQRNTQKDSAADLESHDPAIVQRLPGPTDPPVFMHARYGFAGIKRFAERVVPLRMPGVPAGPPKIIADRPESKRAISPARMPIRAAVVMAPVPTVEQTAPWWEYLQ